MTTKAEALAITKAWINEAIAELAANGHAAEDDVLALLLSRHGHELEADKAISDQLVSMGFAARMQPYLDDGLDFEAAADAALKDAKRAARSGRLHKAH